MLIIGIDPGITGSICFFEDSIDATKAPESDDVTKKVTISTRDTTDSVFEKAKESKSTNKAVLAFALTAELISPMPLST